MERALRCTRFQPSRVPLKHGTKSRACFLCLPCQRGSGSQELDGCTVPGFITPSLLRGPSLSFRPRQSGACAFCLLPSASRAPVTARAGRVPVPCFSPQPSRRNLRRSLIRNWRPVCSVVGDAVLGAEPAPFPFPCLQPPAGLGRSEACAASSSLDLLGPFVLRTASSVFGLVNFLSLFCCPTV